MDQRRWKLLIGLVIVGFVAIGFVQAWVEPAQLAMRDKAMRAESGELMVQLPGQFVVATFTGFKEVVAGALWIRADEFFHTGQYQAIIPIVRLVTWLDPHNLDVYTTGAWHLDYNFVDENQMSDKRYIPSAIALLKEGIRNNPNIWDLYFELGWTHYNKKLMDYKKGLEYIKKSTEFDGFDVNTGRKTMRPEFVDRMLAHQYEKVGRFDDAIRQWHIARKRVEKMLKTPGPATTYVDQTSLDICDRNLSLLLLRMGWRYGDMERYKEGVEIMNRLASRKGAPPDVKAAAPSIAADYTKRAAANNPPKDALRPLDLGFHVSFKKTAPRKFIMSGKLNLAPASEYKGLASESATHWYADNERLPADKKVLWRDGCRVFWMLTDQDYVMPDMETFNWKIDTSKTVVWDSVYVAGGSFSSEVDLSVSDEFYPFKADKYKLTVWVSSQEPGCPDYIQDRVGWRGDAFRDKNYLDTKTLPGFRKLRWERILDRKEIL